MSDKFDADSLRAECEKFGVVENVHIVLHPRTQQPLGSGAVKFTDGRAARAARLGLNNANRYSKKLTTYWDADGKGAAREIIDVVSRELPIAQPRVVEEHKPKSWVAPVAKMEDMEVDVDWSTPGAWMKKFSQPTGPPVAALLETPRTIPLMHPAGGVILQQTPIQPTAHAAALVAAHAHRPLPPPNIMAKPPPVVVVAAPPPPAPVPIPAPVVTTVVKTESTPDSPYDPNAAFDEPPSPPPGATSALTQSQIVLQNQSYTVSKTTTTTPMDLGDTMIDEQMEMTPPHPSRGGDYDPTLPSDPQSPISTEWYYMHSAQTYAARGYPPPTSAYPPPPGYPAYATYPPPPGYPAYPQPAPPPPAPAQLPASQLARRTPQPGTFAVQISRLSVGNEALTHSLRDHFKAFSPTDVYHDHAMWYLEFRDQQSMERAARVLNGSVFQGWKINVSMFRSKHQPASDDTRRKISTYMSNTPQQARAVAIVMADLLRTALHDAQRAIIDTAIKEAFDAHRAVASNPTAPKEVESTTHTDLHVPAPASATGGLDISALPSFRKPTTTTDASSAYSYSERAAPKPRKRRIVRHHDSESEEDVLSDAQSSSSEEVEISSSDEEDEQHEEEEVVPQKKTKGFKRKDKDMEDMIPYKGFFSLLFSFSPFLLSHSLYLILLFLPLVLHL